MIYVIFIILILLSGFFSAAEIALFSISDAQVKLLMQKKFKNAKLINKLKKKPQNTLITILIGNNIVNILSASLATYIAVSIFGNLGVGIATGVVTFVILIFGEIVPKSFAQKNNLKIAQFFSPILFVFFVLFKPVVWVIHEFNLLLLKIFKIKDNKFLTEEEIKALARIGVESGHIDYREHVLIEKIFLLNDISVKEVMTPKYKVVFLNGEVPVDSIAYFVAQSGYSRFPVYIDNENNIIGYVHVHDIMKILNSDNRETPLQNLVRKISFFDNNEKIDVVLRKMIKLKEHIALVTRNNQQEIIGLVSLEDVLEHLVGEIEDEVDKAEENT